LRQFHLKESIPGESFVQFLRNRARAQVVYNISNRACKRAHFYNDRKWRFVTLISANFEQ